MVGLLRALFPVKDKPIVLPRSASANTQAVFNGLKAHVAVLDGQIGMAERESADACRSIETYKKWLDEEQDKRAQLRGTVRELTEQRDALIATMKTIAGEQT